MNTLNGKGWSFVLRSILLLALVGTLTGRAPAQIFVSSGSGTTIYEYNTDGTQVGSGPLISGITNAGQLAVSGNDLFVAEGTSIAEYSTSGTLINGSLVSGLTDPNMSVSGGNLYVANFNGTVGVYGWGATPGTLTSSNASLFSIAGAELNGITVSGTNIFVTNANTNTIGEYTTSGGTVNASLVSTPNDPINIVAVGLNLYVDNSVGGGGSITEYTLGVTPGTVASSSTPYGFIGSSSNPSGMAVLGTNLLVVKQNNAIPGFGEVGQFAQDGSSSNGAFITGLTNPQGLAAEVATPEPSTWALIAGGIGMLAFWRRRTARS